MFIAGLAPLLDDLPAGPFSGGDWQNILTFVVRPLLVTPRHVQRLLGSLSMTMRLVGDEVAVADLIGIEAVRVLHPALFEAPSSVADHLSAKTGLRPGRVPARPQRRRQPDRPDVRGSPRTRRGRVPLALPGGRQHFENMHYGSEWEITWRRQRKVASSAVFRFYLERQLPDGVVPARAVDDALSHLTSPDELRQFLDPGLPTSSWISSRG